MELADAQRDIIGGRLRELLEKREYPKTICPSEAARALSRDELTQLNADSWRDTMDAIRQVVLQLRDDGEVEILQKGETLDESVTLDEIHGPIRVRAKKK